MLIWKQKIKKEDYGTVAIELAIILPVLLLLFVGMFDISNFIFCRNKMNRTAQELSNVITRDNLTKPQLDSILQGANLIAEPFNFQTSGKVIVTSISKQDSSKPPAIMWQDSYPSGATGSKVTNMSALPGNIVLGTGETIIVTEVFYTYQPTFPGYVLKSGQTDIYALAVKVPRKGSMITLPNS
ncbi:MAG: pilus assembly protein [Alphaproteobacteria bacterium]|nr:pilus assembly protein [Alphaproteobacteria bacterium]